MLEGLRLEWLSRLPLLDGHEIASIYFGGGTPSLFEAKRLEKVLEWTRDLPKSQDLEITLEANPEKFTQQAADDFISIGMNRLSLGVQSFEDKTLELLGRSHAAPMSQVAIENGAAAGFKNISIDLMYELPRQTLKGWENTLLAAKELPITHLSLYNLTIEPHTVFHKYRDQLLPMMPKQETAAAMLLTAQEIFSDRGWRQYEISAFAKDEKISKHNTGYWTGRPFLGFGPSGFSYYEGKRFRNIANQSRYVKALQSQKSSLDFEEKLAPQASLKEHLALRLRLVQGLDLEAFCEEFGPLDLETEKALQRCQRNDLLQRDESRLWLTNKGRLFYDTVASEII